MYKNKTTKVLLTCIIASLTTAPFCTAHGEVHEIIQRLTKKIITSPNNPQLYLDRAGYLIKHSDLQRALDDISKAEKLDNSSGHGLILRSQVYSAQGKWQEAQQCLDTYIKAHPKEPLAYRLRSDIHHKLDKPHAAEVDLKKSIKFHNRAPLKLYLNYITMLEENEKHEHALLVYDQAEKALGPVPSLLTAKASKLGNMGRRDEASSIYSQLRKEYPSLSFDWWLDESKLWKIKHPEKYDHAILQARKSWTTLPARTRALPHYQSLYKNLITQP